MKRTLVVVPVALALTALAAPAQAAPAPGPASCQGYLSSYANPNNGFIIQVLVLPLADQLGVTPGQLISASAQAHSGSLEPCIP